MGDDMGSTRWKRAVAVTGLAVAMVGLQLQAAPQTEAVATDACGAMVAKPGTFTNYKCALVENFDGDTLNRDLWYVMDGTTEGAACTADSPETVSVSGGELRLTAQPESADAPCPQPKKGARATYVTGSINTFGKWSQQYGRFEARMKSQVATVPGAHEAFWLWPDIRYSSVASWPASGEIDVVENYAAYPDLAIPFLHYTAWDNGGPIPGLNTSWTCAAPRGEWHTYVLEWTSAKLVIKVDGKTCLTNTLGASSFRKPFIMALSQLLDTTGANKLVDGAAVPTTLEVDYVKVWQ